MVTRPGTPAAIGDRDRGQALTLEAVTAAILLLAAVGFALEMTAVTPLSASTSSQHLENQLQSTGQGVLASSDETGDLKQAVLYWNESQNNFEKAPVQSFYRSHPPDQHPLSEVLRRTYAERNIAYNIVVHYNTADGEVKHEVMVDQGEPSDHAVSSSRTVALSDDDRLLDPDGSPGPTINETNFYIPDAGIESGGDRTLYNYVRVEVIAWRI